MRNRFDLLLLALFCLVPCAARGDVITAWNEITCQAIRLDPGSANPGVSSRNLAMVQAAMFDAFNSVDRAYSPVHVDLVAAPETSREAAAVQAAYHVLSALYPSQQATFDTALNQSLGAISDGPGKTSGLAVGNTVGAGIVTWRGNDGSDLMVPYQAGSEPGMWRPDPLNPGQTAWGPAWKSVTPFVLQSSSQFPAPPIPALDSPEYAASFNEVKLLGALNSAARTAEQTEIGLFWAYDRAGMGPPPVMYNSMLRQIVGQQGNSVAENARLFALANLAMADAGIAAWDAKYRDNLWRPITAIREADTDGNPLTEPDINWVPLGAPGGGEVPDFTPPFPAYVSGHATFGAAMFHLLADFYETDSMFFELTSDELPGVVRSYTSFQQASEENGRSRVYLGIHWNFDDIQGRAMGDQIADYVYGHMMLPVPEPSTWVLLTIGAAGLLFYGRRRRSS